MNAETLLNQGLAELGIDLPADARTKLLDYAALIAKWNKVYNLTAIRNADEIVTLHLLDSLTVLPHVEVDRIADIGAGAGLPGIVLAIARPDLQVHTVDTVQKKVTFMRQAKIDLGLKNLESHHVRVEHWQAETRFPAVISRAFSDMADFVRLTEHLVADSGHWLAMKGVYPHEEIAQLPPAVRLREAIALRLPGAADTHRHLIVLERS
ncbi:16S rRNA (guanine(527)-N(7))-methyltransferase RsmG [Niveibacterium umoris]|uniref:Ribosomal RNA small subunit methyltransferase G n=1 Tax=Niveibacterium umoris TaxID=1193620 RepID=A0A840BLW0_9RHOO|nr:16S rRNA (guanine(527)-N(7))-methyltransferase RsmG [Niveibacterium umoris]MBB4013623.1 16S rRNA (guanine527-N7)-methyltransferase [Niveibacterium umoris]